MFIVLGVFYIILLCFMCVVLWRVVKMEVGDFDQLKFSIGLLDVISNLMFLGIGKVFLVVVVLWYFMGRVVYRFGGLKDQ